MRRLIVLLATSIAAVATVAPPAQAVFPGGNGKIAFSKAGLGGQPDIWTMNPDGTALVNLTATDEYIEEDPVWSPDRKKVAFTRHLDGQFSNTLWVVNANGSDPVQLTGDCNLVLDPAWSPDGTKIAFECDRGSSTTFIQVRAVDGSMEDKFLVTSGNFIRNATPAWSPDGTQIAWNRGGDIWKMNSDGSGQVAVVDNPPDTSTSDVSWSPDGARLAFASTRDCIGCPKSDIFVVRPDGTGLVRLGYTPDTVDQLTWSPDGTKLLFDACTRPDFNHPCDGLSLWTMNSDGTGVTEVPGDGDTLGTAPDWQVAGPPYADLPIQPGRFVFVSRRDRQNSDIYTMNPDGSRQRRLTFNAVVDTTPAWSPDGTRIAFSTDRDGNQEIYVMNQDGSSPVRLTNDGGLDTAPTWSPDGSQIAFERTPVSASPRIVVMNSDGSGAHEIGPGSNPDWSPDGTWLAFEGGGGISRMRLDGSDVKFLAGPNAFDPAWSPNGARIGFTGNLNNNGAPYDVWHMGADGSTPTEYTWYGAYNGEAVQPTWSPDGFTMAFVLNREQIWFTRFGARRLTEIGINTSPDWQAIHGYARPKGATLARFSLVTAYKPCTAPNRKHGPPLAFDSCNPPSLVSDHVTVGTADANGLPPRNEGQMVFRVQTGDPATPADEADVSIEMSSDDVFTKALADYTGELRAQFTVRITDKNNPGPGAGTSGTTTDIPLAAAFGCAAVADPQEGSSCSGTTTVDALIPGAVTEGKRTVWQLDQVRVFDGGADGDADTVGDNTLFATGGLFVP